MGKIQVSEYFKPGNWLAVLIGYPLSWVFPLHLVEQIIYRTHIKPCKQCVVDKECTQGETPCYCAMPAKAYAPHKSCSNGHWGPLIWRKSKWEAYKHQFGVMIIVEELNPTGE